ncbi:hypothetical protein [Alicycliphilus denitrificans]|uniref:hypothetical protein n=1 Tax=Alicycliphilus denitrificans TaxID=179636 RepID=UPI0019166F7E|nr:hypothetical protein [Alicycliphilus denitrificans]
MQKLKAVDNHRVPRAGIVPQPLVPAEINLETFPWAPVRLAFLSGHPLALAQQAEPFRALVLLIAQAWRQQPAMTVPDDDIQLASMTGFGRDIEAWLAVRDPVLQGWTLCSDDRWHHPELATWAQQSWDAKKSDERFRAKQSMRARSRRSGANQDAEESDVADHGSAAAQPYKREQDTYKTVDGQDQKEEESCSDAFPPASTADSSLPSSATETGTKDDFQQVSEADAVVQIFEHWKQRTGRPGEKLTASRTSIVKARLAEGFSPSQICRAIDNAADSDFYQGRTAKQPQRIDTLDVICKDSDRILRLGSTANVRSWSGQLKPATRSTAGHFEAILGHQHAEITDVGMLPASQPEGDAA